LASVENKMEWKPGLDQSFRFFLVFCRHVNDSTQKQMFEFVFQPNTEKGSWTDLWYITIRYTISKESQWFNHLNTLRFKIICFKIIFIGKNHTIGSNVHTCVQKSTPVKKNTKIYISTDSSAYKQILLVYDGFLTELSIFTEFSILTESSIPTVSIKLRNPPFSLSKVSQSSF